MKKIINILGGHTVSKTIKLVRSIASKKEAMKMLDINGDGKVDQKDIAAFREKSVGEIIFWAVSLIVLLESSGIIDIF
tara:strand:+ start:564 stop:797 length:234 start_codon:yes stop_codon:yes gene_type:complete